MQILLDIDDRYLEEVSRNYNRVNSEPALDFIFVPPESPHDIQIEIEAKYDENLLIKADAHRAMVGGDDMAQTSIYPQAKATLIKPYEPNK